MDYSRMFDLTGRRAVVVGGAGGIGREVVAGLAAHDADVVIADRDLAAAQAVAADAGRVADNAGRVARGTSAYRDHEPDADAGRVAENAGRVARGTSAYRDQEADAGRVARGTSAYRDHEPDAGRVADDAGRVARGTSAYRDHEPDAGRVARGTSAYRDHLTAYELDVLSPDAISQAAKDLGPVDILVLTAATNVRKRMVDYTSEEFERVVALNLRSSFDLIRTFGGDMADRGSGSIIAFTSIRAVTVEPGQGAYAATKAGLMQLVRTAAAELGPQGVRINAVAPGVVETPLTEQIRANREWGQAYADKSALGRWSRPDELVGAVVYLASDASSFVTGSQLFVDGGWTAIDGRYTPPA